MKIQESAWMDVQAIFMLMTLQIAVFLLVQNTLLFMLIRITTDAQMSVPHISMHMKEIGVVSRSAQVNLENFTVIGLLVLVLTTVIMKKDYLEII